MAAKAERLPKNEHRVNVSAGYRRQVKRDTARLNRRLAKRLLEDAPKKTVTRGYAD